MEIIGCGSLRETTEILEGTISTPPNFSRKTSPFLPKTYPFDFSEVRGHERLLDYIMIAAAGGHNLF